MCFYCCGSESASLNYQKRDREELDPVEGPRIRLSLSLIHCLDDASRTTWPPWPAEKVREHCREHPISAARIRSRSLRMQGNCCSAKLLTGLFESFLTCCELFRSNFESLTKVRHCGSSVRFLADRGRLSTLFPKGRFQPPFEGSRALPQSLKNDVKRYPNGMRCRREPILFSRFKAKLALVCDEGVSDSPTLYPSEMRISRS